MVPVVVGGLPRGDRGVGARQLGRAALAAVLPLALMGLTAATASPTEPTEPTELSHEAGDEPRPGAAPGAAPAAAAATGAADDKLADIQAVYAWMSPDIDSVNLVMTVSPFDDGTTPFGPGFQYVFHLAPHRALNSAPEPLPPTTPGGEPRPGEVDIICQFPKINDIECWFGTSLYVRGNPSSTNGLKVKGVRIFAGRRSDPFFFNESGFESAVPLLRAHAQPGSQQCAAISPSDSATIQSKLRTGPDRFIDTNVLALVINVSKNQLNITNRAHLLSVWGSTHRQ